MLSLTRVINLFSGGRALKASVEPAAIWPDSGLFRTRNPESVVFAPVDKQELAIRDGGEKSLSGYCAVCGEESRFLLSSASLEEIKQRRAVNWREELSCRKCHFSARMRATVDAVDAVRDGRTIGACYIMEAVTPLFSYLKEKRFPLLTGSDFLGPGREGGKTYRYLGREVRHENVTRLSFADNTFDLVMSFDVLEHVSDITAALKEVYRVTTPGGAFLLSVPLHLHLPQGGRRALQQADGSITHFKEPEYHGDPVTGKGVLCFHDYGLDFPDLLREAGFRTTEFMIAQSQRRLYLGKYLVFIQAVK